MRILLVSLLLLQSVCSLLAAPLPLTAKEVGLLLRSGYSSDSVIRELSSRYFAGAIDASTEKILVEAGASAVLLEGLKSGTFAVPPDVAAAAEQRLADNAKRRARQMEESRKLNTLYQSQVAKARAATPQAEVPAPSAVARLLKGDLVQLKDGSISRYNDDALESKKWIALYFSASWCGPCRKFTPQLVEYYNRVAPQHPELELILVSSDRSAFNMESFMRNMQIPWPAIDFPKLQGKDGIMQFAGKGIPCLVIVNAKGDVIANSYVDGKYVGPAKVLEQLDALLTGAPGGPVAQAK